MKKQQPAAWPFEKLTFTPPTFRRPPTDEATLALARFGAAVLGDTSEPGCLDGADIQAMANNAGVLVLHRPPAGLCHTGQPRGESCSCCEHYGMDEEAECYVEAPGIRDAIARLTGGEA